MFIVYYSLLFGASGKRYGYTDNFLAINCWLLAIAVSLNLVGFRIWKVKMKDEFLRLWINNNSHSPPIWRVNGPLMNSTPFYNALNVKQEDKMFLPKKDRITIW